MVLVRINIPTEAISAIANMYAPYLLPVLLFSGGLTPMAAPSVSLEGKNIGLIKTLPISPKKFIGAKYLASFIVSTTNFIIPAIVAVIGFAVSIWYAIIIILGSICCCFIVNSIAMILGIVFAKFDWDNPAYPIKQGAAMFSTMVANLIVMAGLALIAWLVSTKVSVDLAMWLSLIYLAVIAVATTVVLLNYGIKRFEKIQ